jgi:hypothetical protein
MKEYLNKYKKIIIGIVSAIVNIFGIQVGYAFTYVGDIVVTYPWDEYTVSEKVANYLKGYGGNHMTKQELYDKGLITKDQKMFQKFNDSHYKK